MRFDCLNHFLMVHPTLQSPNKVFSAFLGVINECKITLKIMSNVKYLDKSFISSINDWLYAQKLLLMSADVVVDVPEH